MERALDWWQGEATRQRFLWVPLFDPHAPYAPPPPFAERYAERPYLGEVAAADAALAPLLAPILDARRLRIGIEAAVRQGWDQWLLGERGNAKKADFVGMDDFGASAPAGVLFEKYGITAAKVVEKAKALI